MSERSLKQISPEDDRLIQAYLDDELSVREVHQFERRLAENRALLDALDVAEGARAEFRGFIVNELIAKTEGLDLWSRVEERIRTECAVSPLQKILNRFQDFIAAPGPSRGAFAGVTAVLAVALAFSLSSSPSFRGGSPGQDVRGLSAQEIALAFPGGAGDRSGVPVAINSSSFGRSLSGDEIQGEQIRNVSFDSPNRGVVGGNGGIGQIQFDRQGRGVFIPLPNARQLAALHSLNPRSLEGHPVGMSVQVVLSPKGRGGRSPDFSVLENRMNYLRSGIRTPAADIDWARSDRLLKIVPPTKQDAVPVIWVSNRKTLQ